MVKLSTPVSLADACAHTAEKAEHLAQRAKAPAEREGLVKIAAAWRELQAIARKPDPED